MSAAGHYYLIELQQRPDGWGELQSLAAQARTAAAEIHSEEAPVRFLRAIFLPEKSACFHLFEGLEASVASAVARTGIEYRGRVTQVGATGH